MHKVIEQKAREAQLRASPPKKNKTKETEERNDYEERRRIEIAKQRREEEKARKEEEFRSDKTSLLNSLKGFNQSTTSIGFSDGLKGLTNGQTDNNSSDFSHGLKGLTDDNCDNSSRFRNGIKGLSDDLIHNERIVNKEISTRITNDSQSITSYSLHDRDERQSVSITEEMSTSKIGNIKGRVSDYSDTPSNQYRHVGARVFGAFVLEPAYYQGPESEFFRMGKESDESIMNRIEDRVDVWRESGKHKVLSYVGEKLSGLARKTVSTKSVMGAQIMKVYDIISEATGVFSLEKNVVTRTVDAAKKSIITGDSRYVDEVNPRNKADIDDAYNRYMVDHGLLPPDAKETEKRMKKEIRKEAKKTGEIWLKRIIQ